jgi:hypothetical protein
MVHLKNLSKTMSDLIRNIVSEVDDSREQMFKILENIGTFKNKNEGNDGKKFKRSRPEY